MKKKIKKFLVKGNISNQDNRKSAGITLVALVVTIIILLILAGVAIVTLTGDNGILNRAKTAKEMYQNAQDYEESEIAKATNEIDNIVDGNRGTVTLTQEEYQEFKKKGITLLWEGMADKVGASDSSGKKYSFIESTMEIDDYDLIMIEHCEGSGDSLDSTIVSTNTIKSTNWQVRFSGYSTRYGQIKFVNNGFEVMVLGGDYPRKAVKIYGIKI